MQDHTQLAEMLNHYLSLLAIIGTGVVTIFALSVAYYTYTKKTNSLFSCLSSYIFPVGFFVSLGGAFMTLFYSQYLGYAPCDLCWYQRVFLYPQVFLFAFAWYRKDRAVLPYILLLSGVGFVVAFYHHLLQAGYDIMKPCSTAPFAVDCAKPSFVEFGFVTFPFMAVVLFGFLSLTVITALRFAKR